MKNNIQNIYKTGYNLVTSLDYEHPEKSIDKATKVLKKSFKADAALLFKKNDNNKFDLISSSSDLYNYELQHIINIYNRRRKRDFDVELNDKTIKRLMILNIAIDDSLYALAITNGQGLNDNKEAINILKKSIKNIIMNSQLVYKLRESSITDEMTSVFNRSCYEKDILNLSKEEKRITFIITDLFRLKHINDIYGHDKGDKYITDTAHILKDTFNDEKSKVYRLGGDEFVVVIKEYNPYDLIKKMSLACNKVKHIDLGIQDEILKLNYGISSGYSCDIGELYVNADLQLSSNKENTYILKKVDRRK